MEIIRSVKSLDTAVEAARQEGKSIGLVPTMGALHAGHRSLVERARSENDIVIVSVFEYAFRTGALMMIDVFCYEENV